MTTNTKSNKIGENIMYMTTNMITNTTTNKKTKFMTVCFSITIAMSGNIIQEWQMHMHEH